MCHELSQETQLISIILAAGPATRLRPLSYYIPKVLLPVRGRPVLDYLLRSMQELPIARHYVVASGQREIISDYLERTGNQSVTVVSGLGWETGGDLSIALEQIQPQEEVIVTNGDLVTDLNAKRLADFHREHRPLVTMGAFHIDDVEEAKRFGRLRVEDSGRVASFVEKSTEDRSPSPLVNTGIYVFDRTLVSDLRTRYFAPRRFRLEDELFPTLAREGKLYACDARPTYWWDVGTIESYLKAEEFLIGKERVIPP